MSQDEGMDFNIVEAGMHDLEVLVPLFDQYRIFYKQPSDPVLARRFLRARIELRSSVIFLAVEPQEDGEKALGFTLLYPSFNSVMADADLDPERLVRDRSSPKARHCQSPYRPWQASGRRNGRKGHVLVYRKGERPIEKVV